MIDFVKCIVKGVSPSELKTNSLLNFKTELCERTGLLGNSIAYYKGIKFTVFASTLTHPLGRVTMEGSLHKYFNNGKHNFNDFGVYDVHKAINDLHCRFGISSEECILKQLELGVNINPSIPSKCIIKGCLFHGTERFGWQSTRDKSSYIQVRGSRRTIKFYDKTQQYRNKGYKIPKGILRIEVKYSKMEYLNNLNIFSLSDLLKYGLALLANDVLTKEWNKVLFCDEALLNGTKYRNKYNNMNYWLKLAETNYQLFKYHRNNLNKLHQSVNGVKKEITRLINHKTDELDLKTTEMYPLYIGYITGVEDNNH